MTTIYKCSDFRPITIGHETPDGLIVETARDAAAVFANRMARNKFGKRGYCRHVRLDCASGDGRYGNYEAFIGVDADGGGTSGRNVRFTVYREPVAAPGNVALWQ